MNPTLRLQLALAIGFYAATPAGTGSTDPQVVQSYARLVMVVQNGEFADIQTVAMELWSALGGGLNGESQKVCTAMSHGLEAMNTAWSRGYDADQLVTAAIVRLSRQANLLFGAPILR